MLVSYLPIFEIISLHTLGPGEFTKNNLIITLDYLLFVYVVLPQET